jgi:hypothetical protein
MISAAEARKLSNHVWTVQLEQIERGIKETIIMGGTQVGYKTDVLDDCTIEWLKLLGYTVQTSECLDNSTIISWEE